MSNKSRTNNVVQLRTMPCNTIKMDNRTSIYMTRAKEVELLFVQKKKRFLNSPTARNSKAACTTLFGSSRESNQLSRAFPGGDLDVQSFYIKCNIRTNNIFNFFSLLLQPHHAVRIPLDITQDKERNYCTVKQTIGNYHTLVVSLEDY
jgi:hypothetical protein